MQIRWIKGQWGIPDDGVMHFKASVRATAVAMMEDLLHSRAYLGIYITGTSEWAPPAQRTRLVAVTRPLDMPAGKRPEDFREPDEDGSIRWSVGWPVEEPVLLPAGGIELGPLIKSTCGDEVWLIEIRAHLQGGRPFALEGTIAPVAAELDRLLAGSTR